MSKIIDDQARKAWDELLNRGDRTSPEEYPEMCLITFPELRDFMSRVVQPAPLRTTGPKAVILDPQGKPVLPPPMVVQFEGQRRDQYALDRHMAVMSLDPDQWRIFSLRWGLTPPPGGWENVEAITNVMHAVRLGVRSVPYLDKHFSAVHLTSRGIALPPGLRLQGGVLIGHDTDESLPT